MRQRILIIAPARSTFAVRDLKILSSEHTTSFNLNPAKRALSSIPAMITLPWRMLRSGVVITWFADSSYFPVKLAKMLRKKTVVMIAGYDVAKVESIGYGALLDAKKERKARWTLENADAVVAVDEGLVEDLRTHFGQDFKAVVIPTGYDAAEHIGSRERTEMVLSVCAANNRRGSIKGIDIFAECARNMPETRFVLIGVTGEAIELLEKIPQNLEVLGSLPFEQVRPYYQKAKAYCQLSMREGLPNAVCEAMLYGCIVVGSDVQGVRTAVGEHGFLVPYGDVPTTCDAIRKALATEEMGGREWVETNFSEKKRAGALLELIEALTGT